MRAFFDGGISSVGRALDCDSRCHRFDPGMSPQYCKKPADVSAGFFVYRDIRTAARVFGFNPFVNENAVLLRCGLALCDAAH